MATTLKTPLTGPENIDVEKAYSALEYYGVPRERAGSVSNGIHVLMARVYKEITVLQDEVFELRKQLEK